MLYFTYTINEVTNTHDKIEYFILMLIRICFFCVSL